MNLSTHNVYAISNTHLKISPGKLNIEEQVPPGVENLLYTYSIENVSDGSRNVTLKANGYLETNKKQIVLKKGEKRYFNVYIKVPKGAIPEKRIDYVMASTNHPENNYEIKLSAKVEYEIAKEKKFISTVTDSYLIFMILIGLLLGFCFWIVRKSKQNKTNGNQEDNEEESTYKE